MRIRPESAADFYKIGHIRQYPSGTEYVYSNFTPRASKYAPNLPGVFENKVVVFGIQGFVKWYLIDTWKREFFDLPLETVLKRYQRRMYTSLGPNAVTSEHIAALHKLGYLPVKIKALPEGTKCPTKIPVLTITNTLPEFYWVVNFLETVMSAELWKVMTNATTAYKYRLLLERYALETGGSQDFIQWQGHDFSFRGMSGIHDAAQTGAGHLLSFSGTDTIPALDYIDDFYHGEKFFVGGSVPATEHSVMCMGGELTEDQTFLRIMTEVYPTGVVSIVSDTWDFWRIMTEFVMKYREVILARQPNALGLAKVVFRPDSGDPVKIICGDPDAPMDSPERKGAVECLWEAFGGTTNDKGYRTLNPRVGLIYGDSITLYRAKEILQGLKDKGFASDNVVFGIGSYTYQYVTRDAYGMAIKATHGVVRGIPREIHKNPKTDDGTKRSARGLLVVHSDWNKELYLQDRANQAEETTGLLRTVFENGKLTVDEDIQTIRDRLFNRLVEKNNSF